MKKFRLSPEARQDITEIFDYIADDSIDAAERVRTEIYTALRKLAQSPRLGHKREDLTRRELLFWPMYSFLIVYDPNIEPLGIVAVLHGRRNVKKLLKGR